MIILMQILSVLKQHERQWLKDQLDGIWDYDEMVDLCEELDLCYGIELSDKQVMCLWEMHCRGRYDAAFKVAQ